MNMVNGGLECYFDDCIGQIVAVERLVRMAVGQLVRLSRECPLQRCLDLSDGRGARLRILTLELWLARRSWIAGRFAHIAFNRFVALLHRVRVEAERVCVARVLIFAGQFGGRSWSRLVQAVRLHRPRRLLQMRQISGQKIPLWRRRRRHFGATVADGQHRRRFGHIAADGLDFAAVQAVLLLLEVGVEAVGPFADAAYMQPHVVLLLGRAAQRKRMPLVLGDGGYIHEDIVARPEIEVRRTLDDQVRHLGRQQDARRNVRFPVPVAQPNDPVASDKRFFDWRQCVG